jgi:hypothetical protein
VLSVGGLIIGTVGLAVYLHGFKKNKDPQMNTGSVLMIAGGAIIVAAIPFSIAGRHNIKKGKLMLGTASLSSLSTKKLLSAGMAINF